MSLEAWGDENPDDAYAESWMDAATDAGWIDPADFSPGAYAILTERERQEVEEGYKSQDDDNWSDGTILAAGIAYAISAFPADYFNDPYNDDVTELMENLWPWGKVNWKPKDKRADLVRAGALIAAEIDRLDRLAETQSE
ncbi:hypothetical protein [uncultured Roseobacter sp.]|uniref:hypothetical protein n=1 Tax=uncultured Roseobacter sp. TaxID=114847 RepID=UPI00262B6A64|nr:hypothetical protein [uncultured Roseobacter sp.]